MIELIQNQLSDVLRIGLIAGLVITMLRTEAVTGRLMPLALGVVFVAVVLPVTNPKPEVPLQDAVLAGVVSNLVILAIVLAVAMLVQRLRR
jgi:heme A synthase